MENKKVSIIIPTRGREKLLRQTLKSILASSYNNFEIHIVFHNCLIDETIADEYSTNNNIFFENIQADSAYKAYNLGINKSLGDYVIFTDDDVVVDENWMEELVNTLNTNENIACCGGLIQTRNSAEIRVLNNFASNQSKNLFYYLLFNIYNKFVLKKKYNENGKFFNTGGFSFGDGELEYGEVDILSTCTLAIRREVLNIFHFDENFRYSHGDGDLVIRIKRAGYKIYFNPKAKLFHFVEKGPTKNSFWRGRDYAYFLLKTAQPITLLDYIGRFINAIFINGYFIIEFIKTKNLKSLGGIFGFVKGIFDYYCNKKSIIFATVIFTLFLIFLCNSILFSSSELVFGDYPTFFASLSQDQFVTWKDTSLGLSEIPLPTSVIFNFLSNIFSVPIAQRIVLVEPFIVGFLLYYFLLSKFLVKKINFWFLVILSTLFAVNPYTISELAAGGVSNLFFYSLTPLVLSIVFCKINLLNKSLLLGFSLFLVAVLSAHTWPLIFLVLFTGIVYDIFEFHTEIKKWIIILLTSSIVFSFFYLPYLLAIFGVISQNQGSLGIVGLVSDLKYTYSSSSLLRLLGLVGNIGGPMESYGYNNSFITLFLGYAISIISFFTLFIYSKPINKPKLIWLVAFLITMFIIYVIHLDLSIVLSFFERIPFLFILRNPSKLYILLYVFWLIWLAVAFEHIFLQKKYQKTICFLFFVIYLCFINISLVSSDFGITKIRSNIFIDSTLPKNYFLKERLYVFPFVEKTENSLRERGIPIVNLASGADAYGYNNDLNSNLVHLLNIDFSSANFEQAISLAKNLGVKQILIDKDNDIGKSFIRFAQNNSNLQIKSDNNKWTLFYLDEKANSALYYVVDSNSTYVAEKLLGQYHLIQDKNQLAKHLPKLIFSNYENLSQLINYSSLFSQKLNLDTVSSYFSQQLKVIQIGATIHFIFSSTLQADNLNTSSKEITFEIPNNISTSTLIIKINEDYYPYKNLINNITSVKVRNDNIISILQNSLIKKYKIPDIKVQYCDSLNSIDPSRINLKNDLINIKSSNNRVVCGVISLGYIPKDNIYLKPDYLGKPNEHAITIEYHKNGEYSYSSNLLSYENLLATSTYIQLNSYSNPAAYIYLPKADNAEVTLIGLSAVELSTIGIKNIQIVHPHYEFLSQNNLQNSIKKSLINNYSVRYPVYKSLKLSNITINNCGYNPETLQIYQGKNLIDENKDVLEVISKNTSACISKKILTSSGHSYHLSGSYKNISGSAPIISISSTFINGKVTYNSYSLAKNSNLNYDKFDYEFLVPENIKHVEVYVYFNSNNNVSINRIKDVQIIDDGFEKFATNQIQSIIPLSPTNQVNINLNDGKNADYFINISTSTIPTIVTLPTTFNLGWKLYIHFKNATYLVPDTRHVVVDGYANAWIIKPEDLPSELHTVTTNYTVEVLFLPQRRFHISLLISTTSLIIFVSYFGILFLRNINNKSFNRKAIRIKTAVIQKDNI